MKIMKKGCYDYGREYVVYYENDEPNYLACWMVVFWMIVHVVT